MFKTCKPTTSTRAIIRARLQCFGREEGGAIIVMTIMFLGLMMIMGGMAVDFMRFESRRTMLQSVADRSVLAAADLDQDKVAKEVVIDYFEKAGFGGTIEGEPDIIDTADYNSVGVKARYEMNSIYLKMLGIEKLSAPAAATAVEGVANIEISMVVDISGSMRNEVVPADGSASTQTKIQALRAAATTFAETVLVPKYKDNISLSFVPYSEHVNAGPAIFDEMTVSKKHNWSHCIEFESADFNTAAIDLSRTYQQMQHFQWNSIDTNNDGVKENGVIDTVCPQYDYERIVPLTQNLDALKLEIAKIQPRAGTSIFLGLKWGLALLDDSMQSVVTKMIANEDVDAAFAGRPAAYPVDGVASETQKVIVLMTDGQNDSSWRLQDWMYQTASQYAHWASNNFWYSRDRDFGFENFTNFAWKKYDNTIGNTYMQQLCTLAKDEGVIVYAVAVEATDDGRTEMAKCASSPAHFFSASGADLETIFGAIAKQITELRLSL